MKASEFGQSLLSDIRERNQQEQRRAEKRAKKDAWKSLGLKVAMNVAEDIVSQRHQNLLYNEGVMANKLLIDTVHNETSNFTSQIKAADEFVGGRDAYLRNELGASTDAYLKTLYPSGTYNANEFNSLKSTIVDGYFDKYKEAFANREKANKEFIASGNKEAYLNNIKALKGDGTIGSSITQLIKKIPGVSALTGNMNSDLHTANTEILAKTNELQKYQEVYRKTKNAAFSKYIAENLPKEGLGTPDAVIGEVQKLKRTGAFGEEEVLVVPVRQGNEISMQILRKSGPTSLGASQSDALADFAANAAALQPKDYAVGEMKLLELTDLEAQGYANVLDEFIKKRNNTSPSNKTKYNNETKLIKTNAAKNITATGLYAVHQGWGTATQGRAVGLQVIKDDLKQESPELDNFVLGLQAPFRTALAIYSTIESQAKDAPHPHSIATVLSDVPQMYQSYKDMNVTQRDALKSALEKANYFEGKINSGVFKNNFDFIVTAVERVKEHGVDINEYSNMGAFITEVSKKMKAIELQKPKDSEVVESSDLVKPTEVDTTKRVSRTSPEYKIIVQNRKYKEVMKKQQLLNKIKNERETSYKAFTPIQYKLMLDKVENSYNKLYKEYEDMYGSVNQDSLLSPEV